MKHVIASQGIPEKCKASLLERGFSLIELPECHSLQRAVASHADMLVFFCGKKYVCTEEYYNYAKDCFNKLNSLGYSPALSKETLSPEYPSDVIFNCFELSGKIYGFEKSISSLIKEYARDNGIVIRNVRQGYAKCSVCKVTRSAIITSDPSIAKAVSSDGADVLLIRSGYVDIDGYDYGFIGGCGGCDGENVYFCGDVSRHPDGELIKKFCEKHNKTCISLSNDNLFDVGSLFFV